MIRPSASKMVGFAAVFIVATTVLLFVATLLTSREAVGRGWLLAFAICSSIPTGSMVLLLIHRLTGGAWGDAASGVLRPAAATMPLVALAFLPIALTLPGIYPWVADPGSIPSDVAQWYLNTPSYLIRAAVTLVGWSSLGILVASGTCSRLVAALGLAFFGLTISLVAADWYMSVEPRYTATTFAATIAIQQMLAALAAVAALGASDLDRQVTGDIAGLMIACLLGVIYLEAMAFLIAWYGDLPDKADWFLKRSGAGWLVTFLVALIAGGLLPFGMLLFKSVRQNGARLKIAGVFILIGSVLHFAWLIIPAFEAQGDAMAVACASVIIVALAAILTGRELRFRKEIRHAG